MRIHIQAQTFALTEGIEAHVRKHLARNLRALEDQVIAVEVALADINGPRGGEDKTAILTIRLVARLSVRIEAVNADLYAAITTASRRARHTVKRTLRRNRRMRKAEARSLRQFQDEMLSG